MSPSASVVEVTDFTSYPDFAQVTEYVAPFSPSKVFYIRVFETERPPCGGLFQFIL